MLHNEPVFPNDLPKKKILEIIDFVLQCKDVFNGWRSALEIIKRGESNFNQLHLLAGKLLLFQYMCIPFLSLYLISSTLPNHLFLFSPEKCSPHKRIKRGYEVRGRSTLGSQQP